MNVVGESQVQAPVADDDRHNTIREVMVLSKRDLKEMHPENLQASWAEVHSRTALSFALTLGKVVLSHPASWIEVQPPMCELAWNGDPTKIAYVLSAILLHVDVINEMELAHYVAPQRDHKPVRLMTACGCESRTIDLLTPLPGVLTKQLDNGEIRTFTHRGFNTFGTALYLEA